MGFHMELQRFLGQTTVTLCPCNGCNLLTDQRDKEHFRECGRLLCRACLPDPLGACKDCELTRPAPDSFVGKSTRGEHDG